ncbi:MAG: cysteine--tRNA ligase [Enterobacteriaceae bacterium]
MLIFNTLNSKKEKFFSIKKNIINMYVCGITIHDECHIGHIRTFSCFDTILRYFIYKGFKVNYVRNITDIDNKIIYKLKKNKESISFFSKKMIKKMNKNFRLMNIIKPKYEPRVTKFINEIIKYIKILIKKKIAYIKNNGDVFFSILKYKNYGILSKRNLKKTNFVDFALWKVKNFKDNKSSYLWPSPWGYGRPGWHIECSAITNYFFGKNLDIHGGGSDLIFPHHENEIAQSSCINSMENYSKFWMHTGMVIFKKKISKSKNNLFKINDLLEKFHPESIRLFLLLSHYRHPIYFDESNIYKASKIIKKLYISLENISKGSFTKNKILENFENKFVEAMNNDFNTPVACKIIFKISKKLSIFKSENLSKLLVKLGNILGILFENTEKFLSYKKINFNKNYIIYLKRKRSLARKNKNWKLSDKIRKKLIDMNIIVKDKKL